MNDQVPFYIQIQQIEAGSFFPNIIMTIIQTHQNYFYFAMKHHVHSLNTSTGKQKYSFSKASRFISTKANTDVSYLPNVSHDRRSAIIGYGERSLMQDKTKSNYPHAYSIPSAINNKSGNSLKAGRYQIGGPLQVVRVSKNLPGPNYTLPSTLDNRGASLKPRLADISDKYIKSVPGPGAYEVPSSLSNGQKSSFDSKYMYGGSLRIPPRQSYSLDIRKPTYQKKQVPGPGQYDILKYGLSNPQSVSNKKDGNTKFGHEARHSLTSKDAAKMPGPGAYKIYSEFDG